MCKRITRQVNKISPRICFNSERLKYKVYYKPNSCMVSYVVHDPGFKVSKEERRRCKHTFVESPIAMALPTICPIDLGQLE